MTKTVQDVVDAYSGLLLVGAQTCPLLGFMSDLKVVRMNEQEYLIRRLVLFEFELSCNVLEAARKKLSGITVQWLYGSRNFVQDARVSPIRQGKDDLKLLIFRPYSMSLRLNRGNSGNNTLTSSFYFWPFIQVIMTIFHP